MPRRRSSVSRPYAEDRVREIRYSILYGPQEPEHRLSRRLTWSQKPEGARTGRQPPRGPSKPVSRRPVRAQKGAERATAPRARSLARQGRLPAGQHHRRNPKSRSGGASRRWS